MYFVSYDKITKAVLTLHSLPNIGVCAFVYVCVCVCECACDCVLGG